MSRQEKEIFIIIKFIIINYKLSYSKQLHVHVHEEEERQSTMSKQTVFDIGTALGVCTMYTCMTLYCTMANHLESVQVCGVGPVLVVSYPGDSREPH